MPARFVQRENRFLAKVVIENIETAVHLPNSGRLGELLTPGRRVWLTPAGKSSIRNRKTAYSLTLVEYAGELVSVDSHLPNKLVARALAYGLIDELKTTRIVPEVALGHHRIDFRLETGDGKLPIWLEIKSVTLVNDGVAQFPDAPTVRGRKHLEILIRLVEEGQRAAVLFVIQRNATRFSPNDAADPEFGQALRRAAAAGVKVLAWRCRVSMEGIRLAAVAPVVLDLAR
ncbi:MAG: DNA/RNA nuclease SfsA [Anaerolineales bacterium]|nr:DNA/RNA nuclease SfsA [Anaerolineales bacterium]